MDNLTLPSAAATPEVHTPSPTQQGPHGIRFDFNNGFHLVLPDEGPWYIRLMDFDTGYPVFDGEVTGREVSSTKKYYVRIACEVWRQGQCVFSHEYNCQEQSVLIRYPDSNCGLGDAIGWFSYIVRFQEKHQCKLTCAMPAATIPLFAQRYPHIVLIALEDVPAEDFYATYRLCISSNDPDGIMQPCDYRLVGTHRTIGYMLGVDRAECPPLLGLGDASRPIAELYVCIATQSTAQRMYWNHPAGWHEVIGFLKAQGYRVICIDRSPIGGAGIVWNHMPHGAEDLTGDRPLQERARWLHHADFFICLASGLSWLAWAAGTPVVMISGFSHPLTEFATPYRVINFHSCNSCWNDARHPPGLNDFLWCPRHQNTPRQFECTQSITPQQVIMTLHRIPALAARLSPPQGMKQSEVAAAIAENCTVPPPLKKPRQQRPRRRTEPGNISLPPILIDKAALAATQIDAEGMIGALAVDCSTSDG
ncbi:autotransporter strand-loop-strand O-heptosyltransferase [Collimonas humicola]|uniref:autotransporter strand-loop-strand O-heptosyltransferase n=1 Tax=Collimonas humicola TaxID=2825886 RepID=UPI001B8D5028|nr:autotransporter strand-loop-strand O-heptosyltransferase [Collimonas humicola]